MSASLNKATLLENGRGDEKERHEGTRVRGLSDSFGLSIQQDDLCMTSGRKAMIRECMEEEYHMWGSWVDVLVVQDEVIENIIHQMLLGKSITCWIDVSSSLAD